MPVEMLVLRSVHILCGIFWVGGGIYSSVFAVPAITKAGPAAGPIIAELQRRKLFTVLPLAALLTMLSGVRMLWIVSGGFSGDYFHSAQGHTYAAAGAASIVGFLIAMFVSRPASVQLGALAAQMAGLDAPARAAADATMARLRSRANVGTVVAVGLLTLSALGMSVARYL
jgi:uncharacterized membrane protein